MEVLQRATITLSSTTSLSASAKLPNPGYESAVVITGNNTLTLGGTNNIQDNTNGLSISSGSTLISTAAIITGETVSAYTFENITFPDTLQKLYLGDQKPY